MEKPMGADYTLRTLPDWKTKRALRRVRKMAMETTLWCNPP